MEKLRLVIAEDEPMMAKILKKMMESLGHEVVGLASDGQQAVEMVHAHRPDAVLLDVRMPRMDGIEAARRITSEVPTPIIIVTGYDDAETIEEASEAGSYGYVLKPVDLGEMARVLAVVRRRFQDLQEMRRLRREAEENAARLATLNAIAAAVGHSLDVDETLAIALEKVLEAMELLVGAVHLLDEEQGELVLRVGRGLSPDCTWLMERFQLGESLIGEAARLGEPILVTDVAQDGRFTQPEALECGLRSVACTPLRVRDRVVGVLSIISCDQPHPFSAQDAELLTAVGRQVGMAVERACLYHDLQSSEKKYRDLVENSMDLIFVLDREGKFVFANSQSEEMLGYPADELVGQDFIQFVHPDDVARATRELREALASGSDLRSTEYRIRHRGGGYRDLYITATFVADEGSQVQLQGIGRDVTERNRLQFQLRQSEKMAAIGQLVSGVAHELNNPLTTVVGYSQFLQRADVSDDVRHKLGSIYRDAQRCARIVRNLLTFSRQREVEQAHVDVNEVIENALELQSYQLRVNNIEVVRELDENLPHTMGDPYQLQHVLINLIVNARQAIVQESGGGKLTVRSKLVNDGELIRLEVSDEGPGIPPDILNQIFDPFFTTREVGQGTGLGLSICFGIIREHEGRIWAENNSDLYNDAGRRGATFFVELPVREMGTGWAEALIAQRCVVNDGQAILVVEDEEEVAKLLRDILRDAGYWVTLTSSGEEAVQRLSEGVYDAIITDIKMPGMDGRELYNYLVEHQPAMARRVVFVTGDLTSADTQAFLSEVDNLCIGKPFDVTEVENVVGRVCERNAK